MEYIECKHLELHNLKSIAVKIPKNQCTVVTGVSGSGKSTLVFDILDKVGQSKYLSAIGMLPDSEVVGHYDIRGLSPTVCVSQNLKRQSNPRSTVGSRTGILTLLQNIFFLMGKSLSDKMEITPAMFSTNSALGMCYYCYGTGKVAYVDEKAEFRKLMLDHRPVIEVMNRNLRMPYKKYCRAKGIDLDLEYSKLDNWTKEAILFGDNEVYFKGIIPYINEVNACGSEENVDQKLCPICNGTGHRAEVLEIKIQGKNIAEYKEMEICLLYDYMQKIYSNQKLDAPSQHFIKMFLLRCQNLMDLDLGYVSLNRKVPTLSGGEFQRLLMATYFDLSIDHLVYVFDEPTLGLHESEKGKLLRKINKLSKYHNTVIIVEHDLGALKVADHIIELGSGGGSKGGNIVFEGNYKSYVDSKESVIQRTIHAMPSLLSSQCKKIEKKLLLEHISINNLKDLCVSIPLECMVGVVGISGSGKSSLISHALVPLLKVASENGEKETVDKIGKIIGTDQIKKVLYVSQKPIGRNKKSMVASYLQIWDEIRKLYYKQAVLEKRTFKLGYFSFNSEGACEKCQGEGAIMIAGVAFECDQCGGHRYKKEVLEVRLNGRDITEILEVTVNEAIQIFESEPKISNILKIVERLGLGYLTLGQSIKTISGGEAQRIKLALELGKELSTQSLYILDEPSAGLSVRETDQLMTILKEIVHRQNTVIIIEHDIQMITRCDWLIEMGPGSGNKGGKVIAEGAVEDIMKNPRSMIGSYCKAFIEAHVGGRK